MQDSTVNSIRKAQADQIVCYFIQSHRDPDQVIRLAHTIKASSPSSRVLISHNYAASFLDRDELADLARVHVIARNQRVVRGNFSMFQPFIDAVDWLFASESRFDWLVHLSGQDYPVQPLTEVENFLRTTEYDGFMAHWHTLDAEQNPWCTNGGRDRYLYRYYRLPRPVHAALRRSAETLGKLGVHVPVLFTSGLGGDFTHHRIGLPPWKSPFSERFGCYGNYLWCTLSRRCIEYFFQYLREHPELKKYYSRTVLPEESILSTVLCNSGQFRLCNDSKRYVNFEKSWATLPGIEDLPVLTGGAYHFARKFESGKNAELMDRLDEHLFAAARQDLPAMPTAS